MQCNFTLSPIDDLLHFTFFKFVYYPVSLIRNTLESTHMTKDVFSYRVQDLHHRSARGTISTAVYSVTYDKYN